MSVPASFVPTATPRPYFTTSAELDAYTAQRRAALTSRAAANPHEMAWGSMTMARPLGPTELKLMMADAGIDTNYYYEWIQPGTEFSGGANLAQMGDQLRDYPGLRITYVKAQAPLSTLLELSTDARVWLVDVGGTENYFDLAESSGLIP
jgi:hypothetical protein